MKNYFRNIRLFFLFLLCLNFFFHHAFADVKSPTSILISSNNADNFSSVDLGNGLCFEKVIFCIGSPRSGTTFLQNLICNSEYAYGVIPECTHLSICLRYYHNILGLWSYEQGAGRNLFFIGKEQNIHDLIKRNLDYFLHVCSNALAQNQIKPILILKDPELTHFADDIHLFFSKKHTRIVCIVRDPVDTVASSFLVRSKIYPNESRPECFKNSINCIKPFFEKMLFLKKNHADHIFFVSYEKLASCDKDEIVNLENYIGYKLNMRDDQWAVSDHPCYSNKYGRRPLDDSIGNYKKIFSDDEIKVLKKSFAFFDIDSFFVKTR